jgi:hypothetical protein
VAVVEWISEEDGLSQVIGDELTSLGHHICFFRHDAPVPDDVDVVFTWAPYGRWLPILQRLSRLSANQRPTMVHWNTEGLPDLRIPWSIVSALSAVRSRLDRLGEADLGVGRNLVRTLINAWEHRALRFRYVGDYYYAYRQGWLDVFADSSAIYAQLHRQHGLPTLVAPWGAAPRWYADLGLERDIDVLWMGQLRGRRRRLLDQVRGKLRKRGVDIHVVDNREQPFVFGEDRTRLLNRAKITLNLTRTWYDDNYSRFALAAPNRSLIVSEPLLPHCPQYEAGVHYVSAPIDQLANTIVSYLENEAKRQRIVENAYQFVTTELTFHNSIKTIMDAVCQARQTLPSGNGRL